MEPSSSSAGTPPQRTGRIKIGSKEQRGGRAGRIQIGGTKQRGGTWQKASPEKNVSESTANFFTSRGSSSTKPESSKLGSAKQSGKTWEKTKQKKVRDTGTALLATRSKSTKASNLPQYTPKTPLALNGVSFETGKEERGGITKARDKGKEKVIDTDFTESEEKTLKSYTANDLLNQSLDEIHLLEHLCAHLPDDREAPTNLVEARKLLEEGEPKDVVQAKAFFDDLMKEEKFFEHPVALKFILDSFSHMNFEMIKKLINPRFFEKEISPIIINLIADYGSNILNEIDKKSSIISFTQKIDFKENFLNFLVAYREVLDKDKLREIVDSQHFLHFIILFGKEPTNIQLFKDLVVEIGANVNQTAKESGSTFEISPLFLATLSSSPSEYMNILLKNKADLKQALREAIRGNNDTAFKTLLISQDSYYDLKFLADLKKDLSKYRSNTQSKKYLKIIAEQEQIKKDELKKEKRVTKSRKKTNHTKTEK